MKNTRAMPRKLYFMPTPANLRIVDKLRQFKPMDEIEFVPLFAPNNGEWKLEEPNVGALAAISERRAAFMWGDGYSHGLSYYFDAPANGSPVFKLNVDGHLDFASPDRDFPCRTGYDNHMSFSALRDRYTAKTMLPSSRIVQLAHSGLMPGGDILTRVEFPQEQDVRLTVDFDAVTLFPARSRWVILDGFPISKIVEIVRAAASTGRLTRLDFGGLINEVPDFKVTGDPATITHSDAPLQEVVNAEKDARVHPWLSQSLGQIMTFALACYYQTLKAAMFD